MAQKEGVGATPPKLEKHNPLKLQVVAQKYPL
jgi:hypothetical protein